MTFGSDQPSTPARHLLGKELFVIVSSLTESGWRIQDYMDRHFAYQFDLEERGISFAAGPLFDESGGPPSAGMIVIRASTFEEAKAIADRDPFHEHGIRNVRDKTMGDECWFIFAACPILRPNHDNGISTQDERFDKGSAVV